MNLNNKTLSKIFLKFLIFVPLFLSAQTTFSDKIVQRFFPDSILNRAQVSLSASLIDEEHHIFSYNKQKSLSPASGLKLLTSAAALYHLGKDHQFTTRLAYSGSLENGVLTGDLYIIGGGDPTLASTVMKDVPDLDSLMSLWLSAIGDMTIHTISGDIVADVSLFDEHVVPDYWPWIDLGNYYAAGNSALCIHDNLYYLFFRPGYRPGDAAEILRTEPRIPGLHFDNHMRTGKRRSGDRGYLYSAPNQYTVFARGTVPAGYKEFDIKGTIPDPAKFCAEYFQEYLKSEGITVKGISRTASESSTLIKTNTLHEYVSPRLSDIVYYINKRSVNLYAEQLLYHMALAQKNTASRKNGLKAIREFMKSQSIPAQGMELFDGSGLSRTNRISTHTMVSLLKYCSRQVWFDYFYNSLAVAGDPEEIGYFKTFGKNTILEKNVRIKSGTITGVRSMSGYITTKSGKLLAFSFNVNNFDCSRRSIDAIYRKLLIFLAENY